MKTRDPGAPQSDAPLRQKRSNGACRHSGISGAEMDTTRGGRGPTNTETPYPRSLKSYLLEAAGTRPCGRRAAEQRDEFAALHSMTSLAVICMISGTARPSALAALRLISSSYFVGACTGKSPGFWCARLSPHRPGDRTQRIKARLLFIAQRIVEIHERGLYGLHCAERGVEPLLTPRLDPWGSAFGRSGNWS